MAEVSKHVQSRPNAAMGQGRGPFLHRRHLNESQRAMVAARVREHYAEGAKERMEAGKSPDGNAGGRGRKNPPSKRAEGLDRRQSEASEKAGAALNVSRQSVDRARAVIQHGTPELVAAVEQGAVSVAAAAT